jgi:hypothetical protein
VRIRTRLAVVALVEIMLCWSTYAEPSLLRAERELFASVNQARRAQGLAPLRWDESLATAARQPVGKGQAGGSSFRLALGKRNPGAFFRVHPCPVHEVPSTSRQYSGPGYGFNWNRRRRTRRPVVCRGRFYTSALVESVNTGSHDAETSFSPHTATGAWALSCKPSHQFHSALLLTD